LLVSLLQSEHDNAPKRAEVLWDELVESLKDHRRCSCTTATCQKKNCPEKPGPAWSATVYKDGKRAKKNVEAVTALVLDLDHLPDDGALVHALRNCGKYRTCVHSSHSHRPDDVCVRVVIDIDRPVKLEEWDRFRANVVERLGIPADPGAKDASRLFFLPSAPSDAEVIAESWDGEQLRVDEFLAPLKPKVPPPPPDREGVAPTAAILLAERPQKGPPVDMEEARNTLRYLSDPLSRAFMKPVVHGEPLADEGSRDTAIQRAVSIMAFAFPNTTPVDALLEILRPSILALPGDPPPGAADWMGVTAEKLQRALLDKAESDAKREAVNLAMHENLCRRASKESTPEDPDPTKPYPEALVLAWALGQKCNSVEEFKDRWIVTKGGAAWVFIDGRYERPVPLADLDLATGRDLARVPGLCEDLFYVNKQGRVVWTSAKSLVHEWGSLAREVEASLSLQKSFYDASTQVFHEAVRPMRPLVPTFNPQIDKWLRMLGGEDAERFLDWVATYMLLDRQTCALYFHSSQGTGKTLLAQGLAKLWTRGGPSELENVFAGFNDVLTQCPLVFADECLPAKGKHLTSELRKLIGTTTRNLNRKFMPVASLFGAVRLIIAGNNDRMLETGEELSSSDLSAVAGRFLFIDTSGEERSAPIRQFLLEEVGPDNINREWLDNAGIARHALWLRDNRKVKTTGRFLVEGKQTDFHSNLLTSTGVTSCIVEFLVAWLSSREPGYLKDTRCLTGNEELWVATELMTNEMYWVSLVPSAGHPPSATKIGRALANLSNDQSIRVSVVVNQKQKQVTYHRVLPSLLLAWAEKTKLGDLEHMKERIAASNPVMTAAVSRQKERRENEAEKAKAAKSS
jgi:hypothetical protein